MVTHRIPQNSEDLSTHLQGLWKNWQLLSITIRCMSGAEHHWWRKLLMVWQKRWIESIDGQMEDFGSNVLLIGVLCRLIESQVSFHWFDLLFTKITISCDTIDSHLATIYYTLIVTIVCFERRLIVTHFQTFGVCDANRLIVAVLPTIAHIIGYERKVWVHRISGPQLRCLRTAVRWLYLMIRCGINESVNGILQEMSRMLRMTEIE